MGLEEGIIIEEPIEEQQYLKRLLRHIQGEGVEVLIEGALSLTCSLILLHGVRTNRHWLLLPWLIDTLLEMVAGFLQLSVQAVREQWKMTPGQILGILVFYFLGGYCLYSVASYQVLLRRMNKNSDQIINSVCQGGGFQDLVGGRNYRRNAEGDHRPGSLHHQDQDHRSPREEVLRVDRWLHPRLPLHLPADVDLQAGVRRVRPLHRPPQVLLNCPTQHSFCQINQAYLIHISVHVCFTAA